MRKPILQDYQKEHLAAIYLKWHKAVLRGNRITQDQLADAYQVSRRTIQRALIEKGVIPPYRKQVKLVDVAPADLKGIPSPRGTMVNMNQDPHATRRTLLEDRANLLGLPPCVTGRIPSGTQKPEQLPLDVPPARCLRWVNIYDNGPSPVMHLSEAQAIRNRSETKRLIKTVHVEIPL